MSLDKQAFDHAASIQREFEARYANLPRVVGVGLGVNATRTAPAINVQVSKALAANVLPKTFHGLDVVIDVVGSVNAY